MADEKVIYIAGPMRGYPRFNVDAFDSAAAVLRKSRFTVISPAEMDRDAGVDHDCDSVTEAGMRACITRDLLAIIDECSAIALLPGWENSRGVKVELALAEFLGLDVMYLRGAKRREVDEDDTPTIELGVEFTSKDTGLVELARELQKNGAVFEFKHDATDTPWSPPLNKSSDLRFDCPGYDYRMISTPPVPTLDLHTEFHVGGEDCPFRTEALRLQRAGAKFEVDFGQGFIFTSHTNFTGRDTMYRMVEAPKLPQCGNIDRPACEEYAPNEFRICVNCKRAAKYCLTDAGPTERAARHVAGHAHEGDRIPMSVPFSTGFQIGQDRYAFSATEPVVTVTGTSPAPTAVDSSAHEGILEEAIRITDGDRQNAYGPPDQDFKRTAAIWSAIKGVEFEAREVAVFMIALKLSRETHQRKRDNWVDIAGYAKCGGLCE